MHNKGPYIAETIESVLAQTRPDWEMVIVENGSKDEGPAIAMQYAARDSRIRFLEAPPSVRGPGAARNLGLQRSSGDWVIFLDADDLLAPAYLEKRLGVLKDYPAAEIIAGPWTNFNDENPGDRKIFYPHGWRPPHGPPPPSIYAYSPWALHAALVRRTALGASPWLPELDRFPAEDNAYWFRVLYGHTIHWNNCAGALYRKQTANSRDESSGGLETAFAASCAMLKANRTYLQSRNEKPSDMMAAVAVRTLENLARKAGVIPEVRATIRKEIRKELVNTSFRDPTMVIRRLGWSPV